MHHDLCSQAPNTNAINLTVFLGWVQIPHTLFKAGLQQESGDGEEHVQSTSKYFGASSENTK
jgi:hypothetical protein